MKITFVDEIEARHAWFEDMYCAECGHDRYTIHHQIQPETSNCWWIECENCGHTSFPAPSRHMAIARWKQEC